MKKKLTLTVDENLTKKFRDKYPGRSLSNYVEVRLRKTLATPRVKF